MSSWETQPCAKRGKYVGREEQMEDILEVLLTGSDANVLDSAVEQLLQRQSSEEGKAEFLQRSLNLGHRLQEVASRLTREHSACHNSYVWPFTHDLSIKIFSNVGTHALCHAAATCTMFNKLAMEAACYVNVDLTPGGSLVTDETVAKIVQRAGCSLRTLKLGVVLHHCRLHGLKPSSSPLKFSLQKAAIRTSAWHDWAACPLSKTCLYSLTVENGAAGSTLKALHLYNIENMDSRFLCKALMACPALVDLKVVGLNINLRTLMECLGSHCHDIESLCCQQAKTRSCPGHGGGENIKLSACSALVKGCSKISSLTLSEYRLADRKASVLVNGLVHLSHLDFSGADYLRGFFLREVIALPNLQLKTLILRDCIRLQEGEVDRLLFALRAGECKSLHYLDISNMNRLAASQYGRRVNPSAEFISILRSERTSLCLLADYPTFNDRIESESMSSDYSSETENLPFGSVPSSEYLSENSYSSSQPEDEDDEEEEEEDEEEEEEDGEEYEEAEDEEEFEDFVDELFEYNGGEFSATASDQSEGLGCFIATNV